MNVTKNVTKMRQKNYRARKLATLQLYSVNILKKSFEGSCSLDEIHKTILDNICYLSANKGGKK